MAGRKVQVAAGGRLMVYLRSVLPEGNSVGIAVLFRSDACNANAVTDLDIAVALFPEAFVESFLSYELIKPVKSIIIAYCNIFLIY